MDYVLKAEPDGSLLRAQELLLRTETLLSQLLVIPLNLAAIERFKQLGTTQGVRKIGRTDLLIASIAIANGAVLVTRNLHFRQLPGLTVINWVD